MTRIRLCTRLAAAGRKLEGEQRGREGKGIFIGNSAIETPPSARPTPFGQPWNQSAARRQTVGLTTVTVYQALALKAAGQLDVEGFWRLVEH